MDTYSPTPIDSGRVAGTASPSVQNGTQVLLSSQDLLELSMSLGMEQNFYQNTTSSAVSQVVAVQVSEVSNDDAAIKHGLCLQST